MKKNGFTLIEILIASLLLSVILGALYSTFFLSHKAVSSLDESMLKLQECRAALDTIRREVEASFYKEGDENTIFILEDRDIYAKQTSKITFTAFSPLRSGVSEIKYRVEESEDKLILYKAISTRLRIKREPQDAEIIDGIEEFLIEAKDGDRWVRTWDSALTHKLPEEVRISLKVRIKDKNTLLSVRARTMMT